MGVDHGEFEHAPRLGFHGVQIIHLGGGVFGVERFRVGDAPVGTEKARLGIVVPLEEEVEFVAFAFDEQIAFVFVAANHSEAELRVERSGFVQGQRGENGDGGMQHAGFFHSNFCRVG